MHVPYSARSIYLKLIAIIIRVYGVLADLSGRAIQGVAVRRLACWDCGLEARWGHGRLSHVCVCVCVCVCVLSSVILYVGLVIRPEESYRVWCD
jgi:hypothetical protein